MLINNNPIRISETERVRKHSANIKNVYSLMTSDYISPNVQERNLKNNLDINLSKELELDFNNSSLKSNSKFIRRKMKDLLDIRKKKLKELYDNEKINYKYEIISNNDSIDNSILSKEYRKENFQKFEKGKLTTENDELFVPETSSQQREINSYYFTDKNENKNSEPILNINQPNFHLNNTNTVSVERVNTLSNPSNNSYNQFQIPIKNLHRDSHLDNSIKNYYKTLENLKMEDFFARKKLQDHLLEKISYQMDKLRYGINDKSYQEKLAREWSDEKHKILNNQNFNNNINRYNFNL